MVAEAVYEFVKEEDLTAEDFGIVVESIIRAVPEGGRPAPETVKTAIRTVVTKRREPGPRKPLRKRR